MADSISTSTIRRAGMLAMQGRYGEAEGAMRQHLAKMNPDIAKKVQDSIRNIKPVTINGKVADTSALEKSKQHADWLDNTFIPWVLKITSVNETNNLNEQESIRLFEQKLEEDIMSYLQTFGMMPAEQMATVKDMIKYVGAFVIAGWGKAAAEQVIKHTWSQIWKVIKATYKKAKAAVTGVKDAGKKLEAWREFDDEIRDAIMNLVNNAVKTLHLQKKPGATLPAPPAKKTNTVAKTTAPAPGTTKMAPRPAPGTAKMAPRRIPVKQAAEGLELQEAEYKGREVKLGKPMRGDVKKFKVYVKDPKTGNVKKVNFGDKNMEIKRDDPDRRKNYRARHGCGTSRASDRTKAAYWSCRLWSTKNVSDILKGK